MKLDKKEMKMAYETAPETGEGKVSIDEAFDIIFAELFKLINNEREGQYA